MKIYLFNHEDGTYLGEDFADDLAMKRGEHALPADATTIAPPEVRPGEVPFFRADQQRWDIRRR